MFSRTLYWEQIWLRRTGNWTQSHFTVWINSPRYGSGRFSQHEKMFRFQDLCHSSGILCQWQPMHWLESRLESWSKIYLFPPPQTKVIHERNWEHSEAKLCSASHLASSSVVSTADVDVLTIQQDFQQLFHRPFKGRQLHARLHSWKTFGFGFYYGSTLGMDMEMK